MINLRASGLPLALLCPGSVRPPGLAIDDAADASAAGLGSAVHEALRPLVEAGEVAWSLVPGIAARHRASADEVRMLCGLATKIWPLISASFVGALTELEMSAYLPPWNGIEILLRGHADMLSVDGTKARIGDWKTGRKDHDYSEQMKGYAALALLEDHALTEATATVIWLRDAELETYTMDRPKLAEWLGELTERVLNWDGVYHPGRHCPFCPRSHECAAADAMMRRDVSAMISPELDNVETSLALMPPEQVIDLLSKADMVRRAADRVRNAIKAHVEVRGDIVGQGVRLTIERYDTRELDVAKAWPVLEAAGFNDGDFAACVDLSVSAVEKRVALKAGRGKGAGAVRDLKVKLEEAQAVKLKEKSTLKEKRT